MFTTYWRVVHNPDLTEGRGYYGLTLIECYGNLHYCDDAFINDYCYRTFGRPIAFVQGCAPTENWKLFKIDEEKFSQKGQYAQVGDYKYDAKRIKIVMGNREEGLINEEA